MEKEDLKQKEMEALNSASLPEIPQQFKIYFRKVRLKNKVPDLSVIEEVIWSYFDKKYGGLYPIKIKNVSTPAVQTLQDSGKFPNTVTEYRKKFSQLFRESSKDRKILIIKRSLNNIRSSGNTRMWAYLKAAIKVLYNFEIQEEDTESGTKEEVTQESVKEKNIETEKKETEDKKKESIKDVEHVQEVEKFIKENNIKDRNVIDKLKNKKEAKLIIDAVYRNSIFKTFSSSLSSIFLPKKETERSKRRKNNFLSIVSKKTMDEIKNLSPKKFGDVFNRSITRFKDAKKEKSFKNTVKILYDSFFKTKEGREDFFYMLSVSGTVATAALGTVVGAAAGGGLIAGVSLGATSVMKSLVSHIAINSSGDFLSKTLKNVLIKNKDSMNRVANLFKNKAKQFEKAIKNISNKESTTEKVDRSFLGVEWAEWFGGLATIVSETAASGEITKGLSEAASKNKFQEILTEIAGENLDQTTDFVDNIIKLTEKLISFTGILKSAEKNKNNTLNAFIESMIPLLVNNLNKGVETKDLIKIISK